MFFFFCFVASFVHAPTGCSSARVHDQQVGILPSPPADRAGRHRWPPAPPRRTRLQRRTAPDQAALPPGRQATIAQPGSEERSAALEEVGRAIVAPGADIEQGSCGCDGAFGNHIGCRQRQAAGSAKDDLVRGKLRLHILGVQLHGDAVHGLSNENSTKLCRLRTAGRRRGSSSETLVAGIGIDKPVQPPRLGERHLHAGAGRVGDVAQRRERLRRRLRRIGRLHDPCLTVAGHADQLRTVQANGGSPARAATPRAAHRGRSRRRRG